MQAHHKLDTHSSIILQVGEEAAVLVYWGFLWFLLVFIGFYWFFLVLHTESNFGKNPAEIWPGNPGRVLSAPQAPRFILGGSTPQTPSETCHTLSFTASGCGVTVIVFLAHCS